MMPVLGETCVVEMAEEEHFKSADGVFDEAAF